MTNFRTINGISASTKQIAIRKVTGPNSDYLPDATVASIKRDRDFKSLWTITVDVTGTMFE